MSLRTKLAISFAAIAALVAALMGVIGYAATNEQLQRATDQALLGGGGRPLGPGDDERREGRGQDAVVVLSPTGEVLRSDGEVQLPVTDSDRAAALRPSAATTALPALDSQLSTRP